MKKNKNFIIKLIIALIIIILMFVAGTFIYRTQRSMEIKNFWKQQVKKENKITIPEGWTVQQIDDYLAEKQILAKGDFLAAAKDKEGYLFPDTYFLSEKPTAEEIIKKMEENFQQKTTGLNLKKDDLILASIVEKEVSTEEDRKIAASVFKNRLKYNMALESCATVNYILGNNKKILSNQDIATPSPYNTYLHQGLPPGPIGNPGLAAINAALNPTESNYFYFLTGNDGKTYFAKTKTEQDQNKQKYLK